MVNHAFSSVNGRTNTWIIDSGATCHMCNDVSKFVKLHNLEKPEDVTLGDGHVVIKTLKQNECLDAKRILMWQRTKERNLTRKRILLGYGTETKAYRLYGPNRARVFHSRDVQFNESSQEPEVVKVQEPKQNTLVELDFPEFEEPIDDEEPVVNEKSEPQVPRSSERDRRPPAPTMESGQQLQFMIKTSQGP